MMQSVVGLAAALLLFLAATVRAHEVAIPIGGDSLVVEQPDEAASRSFTFETTGQAVFTPDHDPASVDTWLLVRGEGANGGQSGRISLEPSSWAPAESGYVHGAGPAGIDEVRIGDGSIHVAATGPDWPWIPEGPQDEVWIYFGIEQEIYCARFGGTISANEAGAYAATAAGAALACPAAVCGNAIQELGEACDDGNLDENDGCTSTCDVGACIGDPQESTYAAIQQLVFEGQGCSFGVCHGASAQGDLDLRAEFAYDELHEVPATGSVRDRIEPGQPRDSALYLKLLKKLDPSVDIEGDGMPAGPLPALDPDLLEAIRLWIESGAPRTGTVAGTESLLGGCFPDPVPIAIAPLEPPPADDGVQFVMPPYPLPPQSESEVCFATYYDFSDVIPEEYVDPTGDFFYIDAAEERADPNSHHQILIHSGLGAEFADHASFGTWTCIGGADDGEACDPLVPDDCGEGTCRSKIGNNVACIGFGPPGGATGAGNDFGIDPPEADIEGLYAAVPIRGLVYWNSHAFNLTNVETEMHRWRNLLFADNRVRTVQSIIDSSSIYIAAGQAPYTRGTYCATHELPQNARLVFLSSHTHQRGEHFWIEHPNGDQIYETFIYSDPLTKTFDPPLVFDSEDPADRTLTYCATYNNGVGEGGLPNPATVRKRSVTPDNAFPCNPTACTEGLVGNRCFGPSDHARCDSFGGAGDGMCDACPITLGVSTEDEMFVLIGSFFVAQPVPEPAAGVLTTCALSMIAGLAAARRRARA